MRSVFYLILILITIGVYSCNTFAVPEYKGEVSDHFDGEEFHNLDDEPEATSWGVMRYFLTRVPGYWPDWYPAKINSDIPESVKDGELKVTFVNHAAALIQFDGINVLTDPVWSERTSPVDFVGPRRRRPPGIDFDSLPHIDLVIISHNHYDHMDFNTLQKLKNKFDPLILYPLGNKPLFEEQNLLNSKQMDWWDTVNIKNKNVTFVPARHFANRGMTDRNGTLWGGYVLESSKGPIYFAGDTGYGVHYKMINEKFGPMRFSLLPIAPIEPKYLFLGLHQDAEEAVLAHNMLKSQKSIGIHFGTFRQAEDSMEAPIEMLIKSLKKYNVSPKNFILPGQGRLIDVEPLNNKSISDTN